MENVISRGEQMPSFDAVFSQRNNEDIPRPLCNYVRGAIDTVAVNQWRAYDISLYLRNNWTKLKPDWQGKIRVSVGNQDSFLLNYAVPVLDEEMQKVNAGFAFAYYPGDHFTIGSPEYRKNGYQFLQQKCLAFMLPHKQYQFMQAALS